MTVSKHTRRLAALTCAIGASNGVSTYEAELHATGNIKCLSGPETKIGMLARAALRESRRLLGAYAYAEAEALLRTGWSPE